MKILKSLAVLGCITGFTLTSFSEIPFLQIGNNAEAITIPNFSPRAGFSNGMLTVEIPAALIQAGLSETLRANEGQIKSTEFQQIYLNNMRSTLISGGIRVSGNWTFKYRERIARNPFTGRWTHTPWGTEEGTFYQDFGVSFSNGRLIASTSARPSISSSSWYSVIIDEIIHHQEVRQNVRQGLDNELSNFNGLNLQAMLVQYGASTAASQLGVNQDQVASFINSNVSGINANFDSNRLAISLRIPSLQSLVGQNSNNTNADFSRLPVFDPDFYLFSYGDLRGAFGNQNHSSATEHWLRHGISEGRISSAAFDVRYYLDRYPDLQNAFGSNYRSAIDHWLRHGISEGRASSAVFDVRYYLDRYPDLQNAFGSNYRSAIDHWLRHGVREGRQGSQEFDPAYYLTNNPDVARVYGANNYKGAIEHWLEFGRREGRRGTP